MSFELGSWNGRDRSPRGTTCYTFAVPRYFMVSFRGVENRMPGYSVKVEGNAHVPVGSHTQERVD
jgi:hypothetical protein